MSDGQTIDEGAIALTSVIGEKKSLRRAEIVTKTDNEHFGAYLHNGGQIAALTVLDGADDATAKDVAMHVAAKNPEYLDRVKVPADELQQETDIATEETKNEGKPEKIGSRIVEGRVNKWLSEIRLVEEEAVKDPEETVAKYVAAKGGKVKGYGCYEVGEGIEKKQENAADEEMDQKKG